MTQAETDWGVALFRKSVLKQAKFRRILELLDDPAGKVNVDIGADNGVISYLLRQRGGRWSSADLDQRAVASIRQLVRTDVYQLDGAPAAIRGSERGPGRGRGLPGAHPRGSDLRPRAGAGTEHRGAA